MHDEQHEHEQHDDEEQQDGQQAQHGDDGQDGHDEQHREHEQDADPEDDPGDGPPDLGLTALRDLVIPWSPARDAWVARQAAEQERWRASQTCVQCAALQSEAAAVDRARAWSGAAPPIEEDEPAEPPLLDPPPGWTAAPGASPDDARRLAGSRPGRTWALGRRGQPVRGSLYCKPLVLLGATGTGKSRASAVQVARHEGPVLVVTTKSDLVDWTWEARAARGPVHVLDPAGTTGGRYPRAGFDLLRHARDLDAAGLLVHGLAAWQPGGSDDKDFWVPLGAALNQVLAFAVARTGGTVADWHRLLLQDEELDLRRLVERTGSEIAVSMLETHTAREPRVHGSVQVTARQQVRALDSPAVQEMLARDDVDPTRLLPDGQRAAAEPTTLYLTVPGPRAEALGSLVPLLVELVIGAALEREAVHGPALPPLLVVLDEVAALGVRRVPQWVDLCRSAGVQLLVVAQSVATLVTAYGAASTDRVLGSSDLLLLGGGRDPRTAALLAQTGDAWWRGRGLPAGFRALRRLPARGQGSGVLLTDDAPPQPLRLELSAAAPAARQAG